MGLPRKSATVYQCFTLGTIKNLGCHVWWALQYLALRVTNKNYACKYIVVKCTVIVILSKRQPFVKHGTYIMTIHIFGELLRTLVI